MAQPLDRSKLSSIKRPMPVAELEIEMGPGAGEREEAEMGNEATSEEAAPLDVPSRLEAITDAELLDEMRRRGIQPK